MYDIIIEQLAPKGYLRAAINLSNFLLVTGTDDQGNPEGVSPDLAKALANELNIEYKLIPFKRPGELADAVIDDVWDIGNIANESERAKSITFSHPYTLIESTFLVRESSKINSLKDVDKKDVRIAVAERSAYDLWLTENIKNAELIRAKSIDLSFKIFEDNSYEVLAGLKPRLIDDLKNTKNCKILPGAFTFIKQCIGSKPGNPEAEKFINNFIEKNTKNGFIESLLLKHNVLGKLSVPA
ncbi:transporter substrate-binding domain-containing protein [Alphaproteobacteria bacterium]|nr:transporter substrate-binding domain-containing protein [Alphaproteobacteria bacterium]MDA8687776.1 transporter substrate-binding domain-containing protein [bacterium]MDA9164317.1 transporter substrate-binding domain-containing protein [Alphaproteobacteria bacterium]MDA9806663.1 transporter substrate-binding domain-containing protein [Alphaproteobacteria bacterium]MDC0969635.1 transporter substrate-binding domain-containing protein [Alphaproteobacteria bacterium]